MNERNRHSERTRAGSQKSGLRPGTAGALLLAISMVFALSAASTSFGAETHLFKANLELPQAFGRGKPSAAGLEVAQSDHHLYVGDLSGHQVDNFTAAQSLDPTNPQLTGVEGEFHPIDVTVDNSGGAHDGYIYVSSGEPGGVWQFDPAGSTTSVHLTGSSIPLTGTPQPGGLPDVVNPGQFSPSHMAVDGEGNLFLVETNPNQAMYEFTPGGNFVAQFDEGEGVLEHVTAIAIDHSTGDIYATLNRGFEPPTPEGLFEFGPAGECLHGCEPVVAGVPLVGVALDEARGTILVADREHAFVSEYRMSGELIASFGLGRLRQPEDVAVNEETGEVFVASRQSGTLVIFGPPKVLPEPPITGAATGVRATSATLNGVVDPAGEPLTACYFEYGAAGTYGHVVPCEHPDAAEVVPGAGAVPVHADVTGIVPGTEYHFRLAVENANGSAEPLGEDRGFATLGPIIRGESVSAIGGQAATFEAVVNANGSPTGYVFQYVSEADYAAHGFTHAAQAPTSPIELSSGNGDEHVSQTVAGLAPGTTYYYRILATSECETGVSCVAEGERDASAGGVEVPHKFKTYLESPLFSSCPDQALREEFASSGLADCRAYEQVTPVDKNGQNAMSDPLDMLAAADGGGVTFDNSAGAGIPGAEGAQNFGVYFSRRSGDGSAWTTQSVYPPASNGPSASIIGLSRNFAKRYVAQSQVLNEPATIYEISSESRQLRPILTGVESVENTRMVGESFDGSEALFEVLTSSTTSLGMPASTQNTVLWDSSTGTAVVAGVMNNKKIPAGGTTPGSYTPLGRFAEYTQAEHPLSADGSRAYFTVAATGQLYVRTNPFMMQSPVNGKGECTNAADACTVPVSAPATSVVDPNGQKAAQLAFSSVDGTKAFFMSSGKLTSDATTGTTDEGRDLYLFDGTTGTLTDLTPDPSSSAGAEVQGVLGGSADGSYVYFVANGVLAPGAQAGTCQNLQALEYEVQGTCNLYLWHDGRIEYIAPLNAAESAGNESPGTRSDVTNWLASANGSINSVGYKSARVSTDGRILLFRSHLKLSDYENAGFVEFYRYVAPEGSATEGQLQCISCNPTGAAAQANARLHTKADAISPFVAPPPGWPVALPNNLSADGNRIFFESEEPLVVGDVDGVGDVYEWEADGEGSCRSAAENGGCLYLISTGKSPEPSFFEGAGEDGDDVFFLTRQQLVRQDGDELRDVYDARVEGGISSQNTEAAPACLGEGCKGPAASPQAQELPGSSSYSGPGNQPGCRSGFVLKGGKCMKKRKGTAKKKHQKKKHHKKKHHKSTNPKSSGKKKHHRKGAGR